MSPYVGARASGTAKTHTEWPAALTIASFATGGAGGATHDIVGAFGRTTKMGARDAFQLAANAPGSIYNVGAAGAEALFGHDTHRARQLFHQFKETDPVALALQGRFKEAGHAVTEHPVSTALEVAGFKGGIGRGLGRVERLTSHGHGRYRRHDAVLEGTKARQVRHHSRDAVTMRRERAYDLGRERKATRLRKEAVVHERKGEFKKARDKRRQAIQVSPRHMSEHQVKRRVDERNAANEDVRRQLRTKAIKAARKHHVPPRKGGHLVSLVAQNIVHANRRDVLAYVRDLDREYNSGRLSRPQEIANRQLRDELHAAATSKRTDWKRVELAARGFQRDLAPVERQLVERGLLDGAQAERARLIPYAVRRMGARHDGERIVGSNGRTLTNDAIRAHMEATYRAEGHTGTPEPAYLSQAPNARGARNFFLSAIQRHTIGGDARTGEAVRAGTFDTHPDTLVEAAARSHGLIASDHGFKAMIDEFAIRHPDTGKLLEFKTKRDADRYVRDAQERGSRSLRAVRINPFLGRQRELQGLLDEVNGAAEAGPIAESVPQAMVDAMESAVRGEGGQGPWAVIHDTAAARFQLHLRQLGPAVGLRGVQRVTQAFRNTVLPLSVKWVTGNVVEAGARSVIAKAGPLSYITGRRMFNRVEALADPGGPSPLLDEIKALEANVRTRGGGHFSMAERTSVKRSADQFNDSSLAPLARALGAFSRAPVARHVARLWGAYSHAVFSLNTVLERQFQTALAGKYARRFMLEPKDRLTMQRAVEQAARGLTNTNEQVAMGRFVDRAYGKYGKFSPAERALISYYTPFIPWSLNAVKFVLHVLPKDHPVATGLAAAAANASQEWLKDHGLYMWAENAVPGWLQGSIPVAGGKIRAGRYLPTGFFSDPAGSISSTLLPQVASTWLALQGLDWKGDPLGGFGGEASQSQKFGGALEAFFGSTIPVASQIQQVAQKKGPLNQRLLRQFDPFYPVSNKKPKSGKSGSSGGSSNPFDGGGSGGSRRKGGGNPFDGAGG